jgi:hypothetical protein
MKLKGFIFWRIVEEGFDRVFILMAQKLSAFSLKVIREGQRELLTLGASMF